MRVLFTAQDSQTIRDAFGRAKPNTEYSRLYAAAVARRAARVEAGNVDDRHGAAARLHRKASRRPLRAREGREPAAGILADLVGAAGAAPGMKEHEPS